jgi:pimeloyl-ACP methyl ester carboxylesterase
MFNEQAFIARVESADTEELIQLLRRPSPEQEKALRAHFGEDRYQRMHSLAVTRSLRRGVEEGKRGNVVVIPGVMGSDLSAFDPANKTSHIWVNLIRLALGDIEKLQLGEDGRTDFDPNLNIRATGVLKRHYGELILSLSEHWNVRPFGYDWRKDIGIAAADLEAKIRAWFDGNQPVHLVTHSLGGLVARAFIRDYPERWQAMAGKNSGGKGDKKPVGKFIMLGTPNYGSLAIMGAITGQDSLVKLLQVADLRHTEAEILRILHTFPSLYQILPPPDAPGIDSAQLLYEPTTYGNLDLPPRHLQDALAHHESMNKVIGNDRMIYIAGCNQPTFRNIKNINHLLADHSKTFELTWDGDNRVTHASGILKKPDGSPIKTYYIEETHGNLSVNRKVIAAIDELLEKGTTQILSEKVPERRGSTSGAAARQQMIKAEATDQEEKRIRRFVRRLDTRQSASVSTDSGETDTMNFISPDQREAEDAITRDFLSYRREGETVEKVEASFPAARIEIRLVHNSIETAHTRGKGDLPMDAVSVGHYFGLRPEPRTAEYALDQAITRAEHRKAPPDDPYLGEQPHFLLTQFSERGIIRGELGQPFFLKDPRQSKGDQGPERIIAIAGMGVVGRFGEPELTVLVRELVWSLGRLGKQHLATVLIGAGNGTLSERDAISGWIRGIKRAITGSKQDESYRLRRITFVEWSWKKLRPIQEAILSEQTRLESKDRLIIQYEPLSDTTLDKLEAEGQEREFQDLLNRQAQKSSSRKSQGKSIPEEAQGERASTRMTVELDDRTRTYRFGALTEVASIPQREIPLDPDLVATANDELAGEWNARQQLQRGQFLEALLIPADLRPTLYTGAPVVLLLDSTTARIHWEMLAQTTVALNAGTSEPGAEEDVNFLGIGRSLTRQLRTTFAPPPEPPPPPRRRIRVLVVADPGDGQYHLPGAEEEGVEVADLFERFNRIYETSENRVEVVRLFGPRHATRTAVLRHLMLQSYDILHFAGHCSYDTNEPAASGWIFGDGKRLSANELKRIDRIPRFVFSNACESGLTPDRSGERNAKLAPSFAEEFFGRGVANFVCTAWPVDDLTARVFATKVYSMMLGLSWNQQQNHYEPQPPAPMHVAMREARKAISENDSYDARTWGAYQHYGNPFMQLFDAASLRSPAGAP